MVEYGSGETARPPAAVDRPGLGLCCPPQPESTVAAAAGTPEDVTFEHSAVFVITVVDGLVVAHRDFVDYSTFQDQLQAAGG